MEKVSKTVTDNASNFAKSFKEFGLQNVLVEPINEEESGEFIETQVDEDDEIEFEQQMNEVFIAKPHELPLQERCKAHTTSLIATVDLDKAEWKGEHNRLLKRAMGKATALWNSCNYPSRAEIMMKTFKKCLVTPVVTRWNSKYDSLECLLGFSIDDLNKVLKELNLTGNPQFTEAEIELLKEYCMVLKPLAIAIDTFQGERNCYYGSVIPCIKKMEKELRKHLDSNLKYCKPLVKAALDGIEKRYGDFLEQNDSVFDALMASASHPRFKMKHISTEKQEYIKQALISEAEKVSQALSNEDRPLQDDRDEFDSSDEEMETENSSIATNQTKIEVLRFLDDADKNLDCLQRYPVMKEVFIKFNTTLPSSAPVERLFSFGSVILQGRRTRLTDKNFEMLTLLKANKF